MKKIVSYSILSFFIFILGCENTPITINSDLIKYDWISELDRYDNIYNLSVEDSLMYEDLFYAIDQVVPYKISYDTLIIISKVYDNYERIKQEMHKYKIVKLDSLKLILKEIYPSSGDTLFFNKIIKTKKNDLIIEQIELYSSPCFGSCPWQNLVVNPDSIMYHYGYGNSTKHTGLSKCKLNPVEFSRIQNRLNTIEINKFKLCTVGLDKSTIKLFIKTPNDSIETYGTFCSGNNDFNEFILYLEYIERFVDLKSIDNQEISFRYNSDNQIK